jgi:hypothetical protein
MLCSRCRLSVQGNLQCSKQGIERVEVEVPPFSIREEEEKEEECVLCGTACASISDRKEEGSELRLVPGILATVFCEMKIYIGKGRIPSMPCAQTFGLAGWAPIFSESHSIFELYWRNHCSCQEEDDDGCLYGHCDTREGIGCGSKTNAGSRLKTRCNVNGLSLPIGHAIGHQRHLLQHVAIRFAHPSVMRKWLPIAWRFISRAMSLDRCAVTGPGRGVSTAL